MQSIARVGVLYKYLQGNLKYIEIKSLGLALGLESGLALALALDLALALALALGIGLVCRRHCTWH